MQSATTASEALLQERFRTRISPHVLRHAATLAEADSAPLMAQFTPDVRELNDPSGFSDDPLHEEDADIHPFPDVVRKYRSKVLYLTTDECPVYCRYCTRKRKTLLSTGHATTPLSAIADYLHQNVEINEVIFSGGDPLMLPTNELIKRAEYFLSLNTIRFLRFHTRAVTTSPKLVSSRFLAALGDLGLKHPTKQISMVMHINLAAEMSAEALAKTKALRAIGIPLFSQTVLLKGVNDDATVLAELCTALTKQNIQPYYLHQLDRVIGSAHFEVSDTEGKKIYKQLSLLIPPYMLPRYVRDSKQGKYPLA